MKKLFSLSIAALFFGTLFLASCAKEEEEPEPTTPTNTDPRAKFNANWNVAENSKDFGTSTYTATISDSSNSSYVLIGYLYGFNKKTYATVSGSSITIPVQTIQSNKISGSGVLTNANRIDMNCLVQTSTTHYDTVKYTFTK